MNEAVELKKKLDLEDADRNRKIDALKNLNTGPLIKMLQEQADKLEAALFDENRVRDLNTGYLASGTNDCAEVKRILAELSMAVPEPGKKLTVAEKEAWLVKQRTENDELIAAINRQRTTMFELENIRVNVEMAKKRLENIKAIVGLRTAQIDFITTR